MKRFRSAKNAMYFQTTLKRRKLAKPSIETGTSADTHDMEGEDSEHEIEPAAFSTLSEEISAAMSKLVKKIADLCSIYDGNLKTLVERHELDVGKDLSKKVDFVLDNPPYNVRRG